MPLRGQDGGVGPAAVLQSCGGPLDRHGAPLLAAGYIAHTASFCALAYRYWRSHGGALLPHVTTGAFQLAIPFGAYFVIVGSVFGVGGMSIDRSMGEEIESGLVVSPEHRRRYPQLSETILSRFTDFLNRRGNPSPSR